MLNVVWLGHLVKVLWWSGDGMSLLMNYLASYYNSINGMCGF